MIGVLSIDSLLIENYNEYNEERQKIKDYLEMVIIEECITPKESFEFKMSDDGLYGECGGVFGKEDKGGECTKLYLYGADVNGTELAERYINITEEYYNTKQSEDFWEQIKYLLIVSAIILLIFSIALGGEKRCF